MKGMTRLQTIFFCQKCHFFSFVKVQILLKTLPKNLEIRQFSLFCNEGFSAKNFSVIAIN